MKQCFSIVVDGAASGNVLTEMLKSRVANTDGFYKALKGDLVTDQFTPEQLQ